MMRSIAACGWCALLVVGCTPNRGGSTLDVEASGTTLIAEGTSAALTASATGGRAPYAYRWSQERGPVDVTIEEPNTQTLATPSLGVQGDYTFRVYVTDALGASTYDFVTVVVGPPDIVPGQFNVVVEGEEEAVFGDELTLTSFTDRENVTYTWEVISGEATLSTTTTDETTVTFDGIGQIFVQLTVVDEDTDETATDQHSILVSPSVSIETPPIIVINEGAELTATVEPADAEYEFDWDVEALGTFVDDSTAEAPTLTAAIAEVARVTLTVTADVGGGATVTGTSEESEIVTVLDLTPQVEFATTLGTITIELDAEAAPLTTANLLLYVDEGFYDGTLIHRIAFSTFAEQEEPFVIQGGGYIREEDDEVVLKEPTRDPVPSEADNGLTNGTLYSVSMALSGGDPDSGTTQFFINMNEDNEFLDDQDFTVFGQVVVGISVLEAMLEVDRIASPVLGGEVSFPEEDIIIQTARRVTTTAGN